jgi:hypothetical protein
MRAIPIDAFLETVQREPTTAVPTASLPDWPSIVAEGMAARAAADGGSWRIGQLAMLVERRYRSGALRRFAEDIGESYGTVRRLRWVVERYPAEARTRFATLSFSHFQVVAGLADRLSWLQRAERNHWSVERLTRESRPEPRAANGASTRRPRRVATLRGPIESVTRSLHALSLDGDERELAKDGREWLTRALAELAAEVDRMRSRLRSLAATSNGHNRTVTLRANGRAATNGNGHANGHARSSAASSRTRR